MSKVNQEIWKASKEIRKVSQDSQDSQVRKQETRLLKQESKSGNQETKVTNFDLGKCLSKVSKEIRPPKYKFKENKIGQMPLIKRIKTLGMITNV